MKDSELREIYRARNVAEAELVSQALNAEGIRTQVINSALQNAVGDLPYLSVSPRVWVLEADAERALSLIRNRFQDAEQAAEQRAEWTCPRCAEVNGSAFDFCWKCAASRPDPNEDESHLR